MIKDGNIARPYAKAAFKFALANKCIDEWAKFLNLSGAIVTEKQVWELLHNPQVEKEKVLNFILDLLGDRITEQQRNFLKVVAFYHRLILLPSISALYAELQREHEHMIDVEVISAFPIAAKLQENILQALKIRLQKTISAKFITDAKILGGLVIKAGDLVIDGSILNKLKRMRESLEA
ncbi:MAG: F0F1 ATP synthase subunit delta [Gammaproteobacteria bacterium]